MDTNFTNLEKEKNLIKYNGSSWSDFLVDSGTIHAIAKYGDRIVVAGENLTRNSIRSLNLFKIHEILV